MADADVAGADWGSFLAGFIEDPGILIAAAAAFFAGLQILLTRRQQKRATTFEHLREIDRRLPQVWALDLRATIREIRRVYEYGGRLNSDATTYLSLLNAMDLLALEIEKGDVDGRLSKDFLHSLCARHVVDSGLIQTIQSAAEDNKIYQHLLAFVEERESQRKEPAVAKDPSPPSPRRSPSDPSPPSPDPSPPTPTPDPSPPRPPGPEPRGPGGRPGEKTFPPPPEQEPAPPKED